MNCVATFVIATMLGGVLGGSPARPLKPIATLAPSDVPGNVGNAFGAAVAVHGDYVAVGAKADPHFSSVEAGAAYVYRRRGNRWVELAKVIAPDARGNAQLGWSVDMDDDVIVAGAPAWEPQFCGEVGHGAVYIYRRNDRGTPDNPWDDTWPLEAKLAPADGLTAQFFGTAVGVSGDVVAVSAVCANTVEVFRRVSDEWRHEASLTGSDMEDRFLFGAALDVEAARIVIGAPFSENDRNGAAFVFVHRDGRWIEEAILARDEHAYSDGFGGSVSLCGRQLAIGADNTRDHGLASGSVYLFTRVSTSEWIEPALRRKSESAWLLQQKLTESNPGRSQGFGLRVGLSDGLLAVGKFGDLFDREDPWAYLYERMEGTWGDEVGLADRTIHSGHPLSFDGSFSVIESKVYAVRNLHSLPPLRTHAELFSGGS